MKFPAAPESINATVSITLPLIPKVTPISKLEVELEVTLTAAGLWDGRVGQDARRCPGDPQYKHKRCRMRLSLSPADACHANLHGFYVWGGCWGHDRYCGQMVGATRAEEVVDPDG